MKIERKQKKLPPAMIGTAGHVDHGKTSLVKLLTGCETDSLREEKERGLSINLGFAPCQFSGERVIGIVDVPGHIDFIRNMVTGAASIDLLLLVVAADDGIMPQTVEHLQIIKMLSFPKLIVALTKIDLVDQETVELAGEEISDFLENMGFCDVPVMPVSNTELDGISDLKNKIEEFVALLEDRSDQRKFRMNIQKHFSVKGLGTVATGIPVSGKLSINDHLELLPSGKQGSVRAIQNYRQQTDSTRSRICCALNLRDIEEGELERGMTLAIPDSYRVTDSAIVAIENISDKFIMKHNCTLRFHSGTFETSAKVALIGCDKLGAGEHGYAKLIFREPALLAAGDRFIVREFSPSMTVGGGRILLPETFRFKRSSPEFMERLQKSEDALAVDDYLEAQLQLISSPLISEEDLFFYSALEREAAERVLAEKLESEFLYDLGSGEYIVLSRVDEVKNRVVKLLEGYHANHKYSWGVDASELARMLDMKKTAAGALIKLLIKGCGDLRFSHGRLALKSFSPAINDKQIKLKESIESMIADAGFDCLAKGAIMDRLSIPEKEFRMLSNIIVEEGSIVVMGKHYMNRRYFDESLEKLYLLAADRDIIEINDYRDLLKTGRNITVIILEKFDSLGITRRTENGRELIKNHE